MSIKKVICKMVLCAYLIAIAFTGITPMAVSAAGENLIGNPGFEDGLAGWETTSGTVEYAAVVTDDPRSGENSIMLGTEKVTIAHTITSGFTAGNSYTLGGWGKFNVAGTKTGGVSVGCFDSAGTQLLMQYIGFKTETEYTYKELTFTVPEGTVKLTVSVFYNLGAYNYLYVDDISLVENTTSEPTPTPTLDPTPTPTPTPSSAPEPIGVNIAVNPGFEEGTAVWTFGSHAEVVDSNARSGANCLRIGTSISMSTQMITSGFKTGGVYKFGVWAKFSESGDTGFIGFNVKNSTGQFVIQEHKDLVASTDEYAYNEITVTLPDDVGWITIIVSFNGGTGYLYADDIILELTDEAPVPTSTPDPTPAPITTPVPLGEYYHMDIGADVIRGSASESEGTYTVEGSGSDIWGGSDNFHFVYKEVSGDYAIVARVESLENTNAFAKAGIMIRVSLNAGSKNAFMAQRPLGTTFQVRDDTSGSTFSYKNDDDNAVECPTYLKLERYGNMFTAYRSEDGTNWIQQGETQIIDMGDTAYIGMAVTSHNVAELCTAVFDNLSIYENTNPPANPPIIIPPWEGPEVPVFPDAEGFGSTTSAGRGGEVIKVTNLNDAGPGSLRAAVETNSARIIVFEVSGIIDLTSSILINKPYCTIAGQTAPSPGIILRGAGITVMTHDVLIQHLRCRPGDSEIGPAYVSRDGIQILKPSYNVVVDHISASWSIDETGSTWDIYDVTVSNSIFSEALHSPLHPKGPHSMGFLVGDKSKNISFTGNLIATCRERLPLIKDGTASVISNNVLYNGGGSDFCGVGGYDQPEPPIVSFVGNVFIPGPNTANNPVFGNPVAIATLGGGANEEMQIYLEDNIIIGGTEFRYGTVNDPRVSTPPIWWDGLTVRPSGEVEDWVLANAGARPADRDSVDVRVVNDVINRTGAIISSQSQVGGWPVLAENYRVFEIPENANVDENGDGYTNVEYILFRMAAEVEGRAPAAPPSVDSMKELIDGYVESGDMNRTIANTLKVFLNNAEKLHDRGNDRAALNMMNNFIKTIERVRRLDEILERIVPRYKPVISEEAAEVMISDAEYIIQEWLE